MVPMTMTMEQQQMPEVAYKLVNGFLGYRVGSDGSFWSIKRGAWTQIRPTKGADGQLEAGMRRNGQLEHRLLSALILEAFSEPAPEGQVPRHKNGSYRDCSFGNLYWGFPVISQVQVQDARAKIDMRQAEEMRHLASNFIDDLSKRYGLDKSQVRRILAGKCWGGNGVKRERGRPDRLSDEAVMDIYNRRLSGEKAKSSAADHKVSDSLVWEIMRGGCYAKVTGVIQRNRREMS